MRITVIATDAEYAELKSRAGPVPLSRWLKMIGLQTMPVGKIVDAVREGERARAEGKPEIDGHIVNAINKSHKSWVENGWVEPQKFSKPGLSSLPTSASGAGVHTAESDRRTCLCSTCSAWRKANDIPVGGLKKKERR